MSNVQRDPNALHKDLTRSIVVLVASVEDAFVVVGPCQVAELDFFENFRVIFSSLDVPEVNFRPVRSGLGEAVGKD